jgi:hydrogenase maturation protein HypF
MSALLGVCATPTYEGEAAIRLDAVRAEGQPSEADRARYAVVLSKNAATAASTAHDTSVVLMDACPMVRAALDDLAAGVPVGQISLCFHDAIVEAIVQVAQLVYAMYDIRLVALSGGCFMNRYLVEQSVARLGNAGFTVALNANLPPNDGCVSYGQAIVAMAARP